MAAAKLEVGLLPFVRTCAFVFDRPGAPMGAPKPH